MKIYYETERKRKRKTRLRCCVSLAIAGLISIACVGCPLISANADVGGFIATNNSNQGFQYAWSGFSVRSRMASVGGSNYSLRSNLDIIDSYGYVNGENSSDDYTLGNDEIIAGGTDIINYPAYLNYFDIGYSAQLRKLTCVYSFETTASSSFVANLYSSRQQMMNYMRYEYLASNSMQCTISGLDFPSLVNPTDIRGIWEWTMVTPIPNRGDFTYSVPILCNGISYDSLQITNTSISYIDFRGNRAWVYTESDGWDEDLLEFTILGNNSDVPPNSGTGLMLSSALNIFADKIRDSSSEISYSVGVSMRLWRVDDDGTLELKQLDYTPILDKNYSFKMGDYLPTVSELDSMGFLLFDNTFAIFDFNIFLEVPNLPARVHFISIDMKYTSPSAPYAPNYELALSNEQSSMIKFANLSNKIESSPGGGSGGNTEVIYVNSPTEVIWSTVEGFFMLELFPDFHMYHFFMIAIGSLLLGIFLKIFLGG